MPKLSETQAALLSAAAARSDRSVLPAPATLKLKGAALAQTLKALRGRGLIAEAPSESRAKRSKWAGRVTEAGERNRLIVTPAGLAAIGVETAPADVPRREAAKTSAAPASRTEGEKARPGRPGGKLGMLLDAVARPEGATLDELAAASGWLPHTTRAAITRLRQRGYDVRLASMGARKAYHLVPAG
jgi:hypothetical protein